MTEVNTVIQNNKEVNEDVKVDVVREALIRMGLTPRTQEELDNMEVGHIETFTGSVCEGCKCGKVPSVPFKPDDSNSTYRTWTCVGCGKIEYEMLLKRGF